MTRTTLLWLLWTAGTLVIAAVLVTRLLVAGDRTAMLPGETTGVHHQIELSCHTCHDGDPFEGTVKQTKALNKTCTNCHKEELKASNDSHPIKKFKDPRQADLWEKIDGRLCTSCHMEHVPEITTVAGAVTLPMDYCVACHSEGEQDVRVNRPSHAALDYTTCASSGCHNYHDNKALYEDFLAKHGQDPWMTSAPVSALAIEARSRTRPDDVTLYLAAVDAPEVGRDPKIEQDWAHSAHAVAEVGCADCHARKAKTAQEIEEQWLAEVDMKTCARCHRGEASTFAQGRHGMRNHPELAKPRKADKQIRSLTGYKVEKESRVATLLAFLDDPAPPAKMSVADARVDLHPDAHGELTCSTCHAPHEADIRKAAVESCTSCHADDHSAAYEGSPHHDLWEAELANDLPPGSGVTCATCHMPRMEDDETGEPFVQHNQNATLRPNEKMIRPVCMDCHGLPFAIDALADPALVANNFRGQPSVHIESVTWALRRVETEAEGANQ